MVTSRLWLVFSALLPVVLIAAAFILHYDPIQGGVWAAAFLLILTLVSILKDSPRVQRLKQWLAAHALHWLALATVSIVLLFESKAPGRVQPIILAVLLAPLLWEFARRLSRLTWKQFQRWLKHVLRLLALGMLALIGVLLWFDQKPIGLLLILTAIVVIMTNIAPRRAWKIIGLGMAWALSLVSTILASSILLGQATEWSQTIVCAAIPLVFTLVTLLRFHAIDLRLGRGVDRLRRL